MSLEIQPILDDISTLLEQPALADVGFWEQILEPQHLAILKQAIVAREEAVVEQQVDYTTKISQLLTSDEPSDWQTAIELLHSLDDEELWHTITNGCSLSAKGIFESMHLKVTFGVFQAWCENPYVQHEEATFEFSLYSSGQSGLLLHLMDGYKWSHPESTLEQALAPLVHWQRVRLTIDSRQLTNLDFLRHLPNIVELSIKQERGERLDYSFLEALVNLEELKMSGNVHMKSLQPLSGLSKLRTLIIKLPTNDDFMVNRTLTDFSPLSGLTELRVLSLQKLQALHSLKGLENADKLHTLSLSNVPELASLEGINSRALVQLEITTCGKLSDWSALQGARCLTDITVIGKVGSPLASLDSLADCSALQRLRFLNNTATRLTNIDGLRGCPNLQEFTIQNDWYAKTHQDLSNIDALSHCTKLVSLCIQNADSLTRFPDLRSCHQLERVEIEGASFSKLHGLLGCQSLKAVHLVGTAVTSITGLMASPNLEIIDMPNSTKLIEIGDLGALSKLVYLNISTSRTFQKSLSMRPRHCPSASHTLQPCPPNNNGNLVNQVEIKAYQAKIRLLQALQENNKAAVLAFIKTTHLDLRGCRSFTEPSLLQLLTNLSYLNLKNCTGLPFKSWQKEYKTQDKVAVFLRKLAKRFPLA